MDKLFVFSLNLPTEFLSIIRLIGFIFLNQWFSTCCLWMALIHAPLRGLSKVKKKNKDIINQLKGPMQGFMSAAENL